MTTIKVTPTRNTGFRKRDTGHNDITNGVEFSGANIIDTWPKEMSKKTDLTSKRDSKQNTTSYTSTINDNPSDTKVFLVIMLACFVFSSFYLWGNYSYKFTGEITQQSLQIKIEEMVSLKSSLTEKKSKIISLISEFTSDIKSFKSEIHNIKRSKQIQTYRQAIADQQINLNLTLIQQKIAYVDKLIIIRNSIIKGTHELDFLESKSRSDLKMIQVLDAKELGSLADKIKIAIDKYVPYADELVINTDNIQLITTQEIWKTIR